MDYFKKVLFALYMTMCYLISNTIGIWWFDKGYLKGRFFQRSRSQGWAWVVRGFWFQKVFGFNRHVPWPVSPRVTVGDYKNIEFNTDDLNIFQTYGTYFQAVGAKIIIGKGTWIAPNVGLITSNHDLNDPAKRIQGEDIILGEKCWIGMNSVILPGVRLGQHTVVGAGSVVTKSFLTGYCVIAGNPAKIIKLLDSERASSGETS